MKSTTDPGPRILTLRQGILKKNDQEAARLRYLFHSAGIFVVNIVSGPGTGKTRFLEATLKRLLENGFPSAAFVGDPETENDAIRLKRSGAPVRQILTRGVCHLEATMISSQLSGWNLEEFKFLFIENVGNLVCTSNYDLGENLRVVMLSVTEGEDKPLKYPGLFNSADISIITKCDLAKACECDLDLAKKNLHSVRPNIQIFETSAKTGFGIDSFIEYLLASRQEFIKNME